MLSIRRIHASKFVLIAIRAVVKIKKTISSIGAKFIGGWLLVAAYKKDKMRNQNLFLNIATMKAN